MSDPLYQRFCEQKSQAKVRGIEWLLPYWEWLQIWQDSGHLHERGVHGGQWVMARKSYVGPYSADNVKIVHCESNDEAASRWWWTRAVTSIRCCGGSTPELDALPDRIGDPVAPTTDMREAAE